MKIGLVLFGHLRSYKDTYSSFKKLKMMLEQAGDVDVFCHTWDINESLSPAWWKANEINNIPPQLVNETEIVSLYNPELYQLEGSRQFEEPDLGIKSLIPLAGMCSMLYSQLQSFGLLKKYEEQSGKRYDVVVKTRYDLIYDLSPEFVNLPKLSNQNNCIYLPSSNPYELAGSFSDVFAIGARDQIETYFSFNDHLNEAALIYKEKGYKEMVPELFMSVYLKNKNVPLREIFGFRIHILRANGEKFSINSDNHFENNSPLCFYKSSIEKCVDFLPDGSHDVEENTGHLIKKYLGWVLENDDEKRMIDYISFNKGSWIPIKRIKQLVKIAKSQKILADHVLRDFFEISLWNSKYSLFKELLLATVLAISGKYGLLYFSIIKKKKFG